jgi:cell division protein FtsB
MDAAVRYHINPETGLPNRCLDGDTCEFGGPDFHYPNKHDAEVAWHARQLERGVIAYRNVMQAKEKEEEEAALAKLAGNAKGLSKKLSGGVVRSILAKNISKYLVNFVGVLTAYAVASGKWLSEDWIRRLLPTIATVVLVVLLMWFGIELYKGSRRAARVVKQRRIARRATRQAAAGRVPAGR